MPSESPLQCGLDAEPMVFINDSDEKMNTSYLKYGSRYNKEMLVAYCVINSLEFGDLCVLTSPKIVGFVKTYVSTHSEEMVKYCKVSNENMLTLCNVLQFMGHRGGTRSHELGAGIHSEKEKKANRQRNRDQVNRNEHRFQQEDFREDNRHRELSKVNRNEHRFQQEDFREDNRHRELSKVNRNEHNFWNEAGEHHSQTKIAIRSVDNRRLYQVTTGIEPAVGILHINEESIKTAYENGTVLCTGKGVFKRELCRVEPAKTGEKVGSPTAAGQEFFSSITFMYRVSIHRLY